MKGCIVIGAGIAGLTAANVLHAQGVDVRVLEAAPTIGGRVRSARDAEGRVLGDLGPSWVWPPYQPGVATWLELLGVATVEQFEQGDGCIERGTDRAIERIRLPGQHGQRRPAGGPQAIVDALLARLPDGTVTTSAALRRIESRPDGLRLETAIGEMHAVAHAVLAMPLRVIARNLLFEPALDVSFLRLLEGSPTWMAAQAKALIVYERAFWREAGLSGRIASAIGPLVEAHDHCGPGGSPAALVGFIGGAAAERRALGANTVKDALRRGVVTQLVRCFGPFAAEPLHVIIEDWARDERIATPRDIDEVSGHPRVLPSSVRAPMLEDRLHFAVAETSDRSPGLIDGALDAGERAARAVLEHTR